MIRARVRIREGVARGLCGSCDNAFQRTTERGRSEILCTWLHPARAVQDVILECSGYEEIGKPTKHDLEKIAWTLNVKGGRVVGFTPPSKPRSEDYDFD